MVDFVLGRLKFVYQGSWTTSTAYIKDDIVTYGGRSYVCVSNHTSSSNASGGFYSDSARWNLITDGVVNKGGWTTSTYYKVNDIVKYGGRIYIATSGHTSNASASGGFYSDSSNWQLLNDGIDNKSSWATATYYKINDVVKYGARTYIATTGHTSNSTAAGGFYSDSSNWQLLNDGIQNLGNWTSGTYYKINDIVKWGADIYICTTGHTAGTNWVDTEANFTLLVGGLEFEDSWDNATLYQPGDIVRYGGYQFVATNESTNINPTNTSYWEVLSTGFSHQGTYSNVTTYKPGDVVRYGAYTYVAKGNTTGNLPTNTSYWDLLNTGLSWQNNYSSGTTYKAGDVVSYGGYSYVATTATTGNSPANTSFWNILSKGSTWSNTYSNATSYAPGEVVSYGGYNYIARVDTTGVNPSNTTNWAQYNTGFKWNSDWSGATSYQVGDTVTYGGSTYVSTTYNNSNNAPSPGSNTYWNLVAQGTTANLNLTTVGDTLYYNVSGLDRLPIGSNGSIIVSNGTVPSWGNPGVSANCYYVSPNGVDAAGYGDTIQKPFRTIKYASQHVSGLSTIFVKTGTYEEQLPIVVPTGVSVVGEAMRTTIVKPLVGVLSDDAVNNNENSTMWQLSDGTVLTQMTFSGMTGFVAPSPPNENDITQATIKGIVLAFNPASPINHKSPYIVYCSSINTRGVGALIDGSVHASGNKSMLFHSYTNIQDGGVGIYAKDNGKAEVVSCFTYFCHMGYAASGGGKIRSLNGNHSYGIYGSVARGYDTTEISTNGFVYGEMLTLNSNAVNYNVGETITGALSGAQGTVTGVQSSAGQVYYYRTTANTFTTNELVTGSGTGYAANTLSSNSVTGQGNYVLILSGLPKLPAAGQSLELVGDSTSYIIQTVSGSYANTSSVITVILTSQKVTPSSNGTVIRIRNGFSNIRLTGHDFLNIGVGNTSVSAYPNVNTALTIQANETVAINPGRVYYTSTDQDGNFRVGQYFAVNQATGAATLNASAFNLSGLTSLRLGSIGAQVGALISEFSTDGALSANSDSKVPTQQAVKTYVDTVVAPVLAQYLFDDISAQFNGTTKSFTLTVSNSTVTSANVQITNPWNLDVKLGDVRVYPTSQKTIIPNDVTFQNDFGIEYRFKDGFYLSGSSNNIINFYKAPIPGMSFMAKIGKDLSQGYLFDVTAKVPYPAINVMFSD